MKKFVINNNEFIVEVIVKRNNKRVYLRYKDGIIMITTPVLLSDEYITSMIKKHYNSIIKIANNTYKKDSIHYLGKEYMLMVYDSSKDYVEFKDDIAYIYTSNNNESHIYNIVYKEYFNTIKMILEEYHQEYEMMFDVNNIHYKIKDVKGYFGECYSKRKLVIMNAKLAKYDKPLILSVLAHELAHFKYQNHSKDFYDYLEMLIPGYRKLQKELKRTKYHDKY